MENRNAYFKPLIKDGMLFLDFFPAEEGGKALDAKEVVSYLTGEGYHEYDTRALNQAVSSMVPEQVFVGRSKTDVIPEKAIVSLSLDAMLIRCKFYPASDGGRAVTLGDIQDELAHKKVVYGVDENMLNRLMGYREYC